MNSLKKQIALILLIAIMISFCSPGLGKVKAKEKPAKQKNITAVKNTKKQICHKTAAPSQLYVLSSYKEAEVYIDEDLMGKAPINIKNAKPGKYLVEAYIGKELLFRQYIIVKPGIPSVVEINGNKQVAEEEKNYIIL